MIRIAQLTGSHNEDDKPANEVNAEVQPEIKSDNNMTQVECHAFVPKMASKTA